MSVTITTAASTDATFGQRKDALDPVSGYRWKIVSQSGYVSDLWYTKDNGATWTKAATTQGQLRLADLYIDADGYAHAFGLSSNGYNYYSRGTPNAGRTDWSWTVIATSIGTTGSRAHIDGVVRDGSGGWLVLLSLAYRSTNTETRLYRYTVPVASNGTQGTPTGGQVASSAINSSGYGDWDSGGDYNHDGSGTSTPAAVVRYAYMPTWNTAGVFRGYQDTTQFTVETLNTPYGGRADGKFDGAGKYFVAYFKGTTAIGVVYWDGASVTTIHPPTQPSGTLNDVALVARKGRAYVFVGTSSGLYRAVWDGTSWSAWVQQETDAVVQDTLSAQFLGGRAVCTYALSGFVVKESVYVVNTAPNAPTLTSPASSATLDRAILQRFAWTFSDPDSGDSQSKYDFRYRTVGSATWTTVSATTPNGFRDIAAGTFAAGNYEWQVLTYDSQGVGGPWSSSSFFTAADAPAAPTITAPTSGGTVPSAGTVTWSDPSQDGYQVRRVADNAGTPDTATVYSDTGQVNDTTARSLALTFPTNDRWEHIQVRILKGGLWSAWASVRVQVSYTPPAKPTVSLAVQDQALVVTVTNPTPSGGQPAVTSNEIWVDDGSGSERRATIAANGTWTYWTPRAGRDYFGRITAWAVADNGTRTQS